MSEYELFVMLLVFAALLNPIMISEVVDFIRNIVYYFQFRKCVKRYGYDFCREYF